MTYTSVDQVAPGRPSEILRAAGDLSRLANNLEEAKRRMGSLVDGISRGGDMLQGAAADSFAAKFKELPPSLGNVSEAAHSLGWAISRWGNEVDGLRAEAKRALDRYNAQKRRRDTAQGQVNAAAARLSQLRAQVGGAESRERGHIRDHRRESRTGQQAAADTSYQQYQAAFRERVRLERQRDDAVGQKRNFEATLNSADSEMRAAQQELQRILDRHGERDREAARAIERALPASLRNKSGLHKALNYVGDQIDKATKWMEELLLTIDAMVDAALDGDWETAVFRFREMVDQLTPIVTALVTALSIVALFIPVPGLNLLLAAALTLAVARFASTGFLLASDADDPDHPGKKAASLGELFSDGMNVALAAATMGKGAPKPKPGGWETGAKSFLAKPQSGNILKRSVENVARPIANQMVKHPIATRVGEKIIWEKAIKPKVDAKVKDIKEWGTNVVIDRAALVVGVDPNRLRSTYETVNEINSEIDKVKKGRDWLKGGKAPASAPERFIDLVKIGQGTYEGAHDLSERLSDVTGFNPEKVLVGEVDKMVSELACTVPSGGGR